MSELCKKVRDFEDIDQTMICYCWSPTYTGDADGKDYPGEWMFFIPHCGIGRLGKHQVTEHEDGTITVSPSILLTGRNDDNEQFTRHGFIERGVWREA